jgi:hypothetical protein
MVNTNGTEQIDISVLNVSQNDSGIYQSVNGQNSKVDGCCLLIIIAQDKEFVPSNVFRDIKEIKHNIQTCYN